VNAVGGRERRQDYPPDDTVFAIHMLNVFVQAAFDYRCTYAGTAAPANAGHLGEILERNLIGLYSFE
jgi:hypothetical protein